MRKNEEREFSWAWKIFVPVAIVVMGLNLLLAGVFGNKPDRTGRDMKKSGKASKRVRAFFSSSARLRSIDNKSNKGHYPNTTER